VCVCVCMCVRVCVCVMLRLETTCFRLDAVLKVGKVGLPKGANKKDPFFLSSRT